MRWRCDVRTRAGEPKVGFADANLRLDETVLEPPPRGGGASRSETVIAIIGQASPPVSERPSAIENVNVGLTLK